MTSTAFDFDFERGNLNRKWERAKKRAKRLNCPVSFEEGESYSRVKQLQAQLDGIERANELAKAIGISKIDFRVQTQTLAQYLHAEEIEENKNVMTHALCQWQAAAKKARKFKDIRKH